MRPAEMPLALRAFIATLAIATCLGGCGREKVPKLSPVGPDDVIVAFGDSLTYGTGASEAESYPIVLGDLIKRKVVRAGVPGEVTSGGLARLESVIDEHQPKLMIVCLGGNDMLGRTADGPIVENLREIIKTIRGRGISVMLIGVPRPALITQAAPFYAELAREFDIPYEGTIVTDVLYQRDLKSDPIHPNAKGYRKMAEAIAKLLKKAGAI
jgi:lysophospholipase L1-like esterase